MTSKDTAEQQPDRQSVLPAPDGDRGDAWRIRIETAKKVRKAAIAARKGKLSTFPDRLAMGRSR